MALVYLAAVWIGGVYAGAAVFLPGVLPLLACACSFLLALIWWRQPLPRWLFLCAAVAAVAFWRANGAQLPPGPDNVFHLNETTVTLRGTVDAEPEVVRGTQRFVLRAQSRSGADGDRPVEGLVAVTAPRFPEYRHGQVLRLEGHLQTPPQFDGFAYRDYLSRQGIYSLSRYPKVTVAGQEAAPPLQGALDALRAAIGSQLRRTLPEPHAALAGALLLGERADLPDDLVDAFRVAGVSHVLAVSGWQVSLVVGLLGGVGGRVLRRRHYLQFALAAVLVAGYVLLVGASPAVMRAGLMGVAALAAVALGRPRDGLSALAAACLAMTAIEPLVVLDVGFRLSALATLGLIVLSPRLRWLEDHLPGWIGSVLGMTIAAEAMVLPVLAAEFNVVSLVSLPANLIVVPLVPGAMEWAAVSALLGALWAPLGTIPAALASLYLGAAIWAVERLAGLPLAAVTVPEPHPVLAAAYYGAVWVVVDGGRRASAFVAAVGNRVPFAVPGRALLLSMGAAAIVLSGMALRPDGILRVSFLDVGQGDAILIQTPSGRRVLVDGGPEGVGVQNALGRRLPFGDKSLDLVVLTHPHDDHLLGLIDVLQSHGIGQVLQGAAPDRPSAAYRRWTELLAATNVPVARALTGQTIDLGAGARIRVVHAGEAWSGEDEDLNDASVALAVERGSFSLLLPGDGGPAVQRWLNDRGEAIALTALKVPHHGAPGALDPAFLRLASPQAAVVSVGRANRFAHPAAEVLTSLSPAEIFRTDLHGSIELSVAPDGAYRFAPSR